MWTSERGAVRLGFLGAVRDARRHSRCCDGEVKLQPCWCPCLLLHDCRLPIEAGCDRGTHLRRTTSTACGRCASATAGAAGRRGPAESGAALAAPTTGELGTQLDLCRLGLRNLGRHGRILCEQIKTGKRSRAMYNLPASPSQPASETHRPGGDARQFEREHYETIDLIWVRQESQALVRKSQWAQERRNSGFSTSRPLRTVVVEADRLHLVEQQL